VALALTAGCGKVPERQYVLSEKTLALEDTEARAAVSAALEKHFGTPQSPRIEAPDPLRADVDALVTQERLDAGTELYRIHCLHCHGVSGDGQGPTAPFLFPTPRDYRLGRFKFTSTSGDHPTRDDLRRTLDEGITGTSMPSFKLLADEQIESIIDYVMLLSMRGELENLLLGEAQFGVPDEGIVADNLEQVIRRWKNAPSEVVHPREAMPPYSDELALAGRELFLTTTGAQCVGCHGRDFRGRGNQAMNPDDWGNTIRPADLTLGLYRGGRRPIDIYMRIATGIKGTPMPAFRNSLTDQQIWEIVHFVRALPYRKDFQQAPPAAKADTVASRQ
jgi:mono/diheme cytochrome c family protein